MTNIPEIGPELDIYIVRHGQSTANAEKVLQGWADYPLSQEGILQARVTGRYLVNSGVNLKAIYTSPLTRARRTAEEIARRFRPAVEVTAFDEFKEVDIGTLTDMPIEEARTEYNDFFQAVKVEFGDYECF